MEAGTTDTGVAGKGRLVVLYVLLAALVAAVAVIVIHKGQDEHPQPAIAGGYDAAAPNPCLGAVPPTPPGAPLPVTAPGQPAPAGPSFDVKQSGQFVNFTNVQETLGAKLRLHQQKVGGGHRLTGTVDCVKGRSLHLDAVAIPGTQGQIVGRLGALPLTANLKRDPPDPGTPKPRAPTNVGGIYKLSPRSACFGGRMELTGDAPTYGLKAKDQKLGTVNYVKKTGALSGDVACAKGGHARLRGTAVDLNINNLQLIPLDAAKPAKAAKKPVKPAAGAAPAKPVLTTPSGLPPAGEKFTATKQRESFGKLVAAFFLAVAIVMIIARAFGILATWISQPRVMGEVVAGICLGPSVFGAISPQLQASLFSTDILPAFGIAANLGLIFYMFLVGLEVDREQLRGRVGQAAAISNVSVALPMLLGMAVALPIYKLVGPDKKFVAFALFMGVAMSITAFPVLARILVERRMLKRPLGALALACAAIDDVTAWFLIALATTIAVAGTFGEVARTIGEAIAFCLIMAFLVRPVIGRVSNAFDEVGRVPTGWVTAIFAGIVLSAFVTERIGIAVIFGGFIMGMIMPRHARLTEDVTRRLEDFVVLLLLPMFFAYTGLRTNIGLLDRPVLWGITGILIAVAIVGKLFGAAIAARVSGFNWRASGVIGTLMNTRGLTELIVLNLALEKGVISDALFAMLVLMALVTTFMAGPLLRLLDPRNMYGMPVEEEFAEARARSSVEFPEIVVPDRSILVAPQTDAALPHLLTIAEPLARSAPPRELVIARLVEPPRGAGVRGGLHSEEALLRRASDEVTRERLRLIDDGIATRGVVLSSSSPGNDLARLVEKEDVDLVLIEGQRPLLGEGIPLGEVKPVLQSAPCDVAVLVARETERIQLGPRSSVVVPFGGAEHDWSALELGSWIAARTDTALTLLGAGGQTEEKAVGRLLGDANTLVQQFAGIDTEQVVVRGGRDEILAAADGAGLLVIGLSERWRDEGLGETRSAIARSATSPVLFVRRGSRPGALAPPEDSTRFAWSSAAVGQGPPQVS